MTESKNIYKVMVLLWMKRELQHALVDGRTLNVKTMLGNKLLLICCMDCLALITIILFVCLLDTSSLSVVKNRGSLVNSRIAHLASNERIILKGMSTEFIFLVPHSVSFKSLNFRHPLLPVSALQPIKLNGQSIDCHVVLALTNVD